MSNISDVAREAGVSAMTVSRYFNHPGKLAPSTQKRVKEAVAVLNYVPNAAARSLVRGQTHTVAAVLSDIANPFFTTLARGIEDVAQQHGYTLFIGNTDESFEKEQHYLRTLLSRRVDGLLLSPSLGDASSLGDDQRLEAFNQRNIPVVLIDRKAENMAADVLRGDSFGGGRQLAAHLAGQGYADIAFVGGEPGVSSLEDRLAGYRAAMEAAGLEPRAHLGHYTRQSGEEIIWRLAKENALPEAIVAANNLVAVGALRALRQCGLRVPGDVALVCFEDIEIAAMIDPFLTVAAQPAYDMGQTAMQMLLRRLKGYDGPPEEKVFPVDLIVRRSSLRAPTTTAPGAP